VKSVSAQQKDKLARLNPQRRRDEECLSVKLVGAKSIGVFEGTNYTISLKE